MTDENNDTTPQPEAEVVVMRAGPASDTSKILAAVGYLFFIIAIVLLLIEPYKDEDFVRFNAYQAIALQVVIWVGWMVPVVGWIVAIVAIVFSIIAMVKTFMGEYYEVPVLYGLVKGFVGI